MPQPFDYRLQVQNPMEAALSGLRLGAGIQEIRDARAAALAKQESDRQFQESYQSVLANPNATGEDYGRLVAMRPEMQQAITKSWEMRDESSRKADFPTAQKAFYAAMSGDPQTAANVLLENAAAYRNAGREEDAKRMEAEADAVATNPENSKLKMGMFLASVAPKEYAEILNKLGMPDGAGASAENKYQKGEGVTVNIGGKLHIAIPVFNPAKGEFEVQTKPIGGEIVSPTTGLTPDQASKMKATTAGREAYARIEAGIATAEDQARVDRLRKSEEIAGGKAAEQGAAYIEAGIAAVDAMPELHQAVDLLSKIKTGGKLASASMWVKQNLGVETADEGELSYLLGKNVLQQLRPTFGAAFTVNEKEELKGIESGFGKNNETNVRLLTRVIAISERAARRGLTAAKVNKDKFGADEIQRGLDSIEELKRNLSAGKTQSGSKYSIEVEQ